LNSRSFGLGAIRCEILKFMLRYLIAHLRMVLTLLRSILKLKRRFAR